MKELQLLVKYEELTELWTAKKMRFDEFILRYLNNEINMSYYEIQKKMSEMLFEIETVKHEADMTFREYRKIIDADKKDIGMSLIEVVNNKNEAKEKVQEEVIEVPDIEQKVYDLIKYKKTISKRKMYMDRYSRETEQDYLKHGNNPYKRKDISDNEIRNRIRNRVYFSERRVAQRG